MTLERNSLMERVYPQLKNYCRERHGLDFQGKFNRSFMRDSVVKLTDIDSLDVC